MAMDQVAAGQGRLTAQQRQSYAEDGFLIVRAFFDSATMEQLADAAASLLARTDLIDKHNLRCRFQSHCREDGDCVFETFDPVIDLSPPCKRIASNERLLSLLGDLYGEEACLFKDKLIFKPPGALGYRLHQDFIAWPSFPRSFLSVLVPIDPARKENGCTEVFPGYHHNGSLTVEDGDYHDLPADCVDESRGVKLILEPGDIAVFGGFTPHRSAPNRSQSWRRQLYLSYNALSDGGHQREAHYREFRDFLRRKYAQYGLTDTYYL